MTRSAPDTTRGKKAAETRAKLVSTARTLFGQHGYAVDIRTIAGALGMSTGAVFGHFTGKADLFAAAFPEDHARRRLAEAICLALGGTWSADPVSTYPWFAAADRVLVGLVARRAAA